MPIWKEERGMLNPLACRQVGSGSDFPGASLWAEELKAGVGSQDVHCLTGLEGI